MWRPVVWIDEEWIARHWCARSTSFRLTRWRDGWVVWVETSSWADAVAQLRGDGYFVPVVAVAHGYVIPDLGCER